MSLATALGELARARGSLNLDAGVAALDHLLARVPSPSRDDVIAAAAGLTDGERIAAALRTH